MTDFYAVLRDALARIGPGDVDQRTRVYGQVRTLMARRLANRRPPLSPDELARRADELESAINRIEAETMLDDELVTEAPRPATPPPDPEDLWGAAREAPMPPAAPSIPQTDGEAPQAIWGTPAIDLAWDQTTEQWLDPSEIAARTSPPAAPRMERPINGRATSTGSPPPRVAAPKPTASAAPRLSQDQPPMVRDTPRPASPPRVEPRIDSRAPPPDTRAPAGRAGDSGARQRGEVRWPQLDPAPPPSAPNSGAPRTSAPRRPPDPAALDAAFAAAERAPAARQSRGEPRLESPAAKRNDAPPVLFIEDRSRTAPAPVAEARSAPSRRTPDPRSATQPPAAEAYAPPPAIEDLPEDFAVEDTPERPRQTGRPRRSVGRKFAIALGVVAVLVLAWCLYVFIPILFPGSDDPAAPAATGEARVPAEAGAPIVIFGGEERSVFVGLPDNPVGYETAENGAFARIASSTAGGARVTIGRSVAQQLGGHTIRVAIDARGTPGRESITARLGYQRSDGLLEWQTINLGANFDTWTVDWTIPGGTSTGDFLIIEPGIPGDGTALDVRRLTIQILE